jgi:hypothetical protein
MSGLLDIAVASDVRVTSEWLAVDSMPLDLSYRLDLDEQLVSLCKNLTEIIQVIQKGGHVVDRVAYYNVPDRELNPTCDRPFVRILFKRKHD